MFTLIDLIREKSLPLELAAFLLCRVSKGDSFLTGAVPGGAGKTTLMCALINCIPNDMLIRHAESPAAMLLGENLPPSCFVCHEIGRGDYFAYLWGEEARQFFRLKSYGHILASNLHADNLEEARLQLVKQNGVKENEFNSVNLYLFLAYGVQRKVSSVWCSKEGEPHREVYDGSKLNARGLAGEKDLKISEEFLLEMDEENVHTIEDFRKELAGFRDG
ncbi:MAG: hypothetical protein WCI43_02390 [Candidatus Firestonebacteria bacterium]